MLISAVLSSATSARICQSWIQLWLRKWPL